MFAACVGSERRFQLLIRNSKGISPAARRNTCRAMAIQLKLKEHGNSMAQEIECKVMGMKLNDFFHLTARRNLCFKVDLEMMVTDTYWEFSPSASEDLIRLIRCRRCRVRDGEGFEDFYDLTIKGSEESSGDMVSSGSEIILELRRSVEPEDIDKFLNLIGATKKYTVKKERTLLYNDDSEWEDSRNVRIHHDKIIDGGIDSQEWIEIETGRGAAIEVQKTILELGINPDMVSNKSTLDILHQGDM